MSILRAIASLLWISQQRRPRLLWRLLGYGVLFVLLSLPLGFLWNLLWPLDSEGSVVRDNSTRTGPVAAVLLAWALSSLLFGLGHARNPHSTWISIANLMVAGLCLGLGYLLTGDLAIPIGLHIAWNFTQGNVFGFPVSGMSVANATLITIRQRGPDLWTGGVFGPEAGLLGLLANVVGCGLIIWWVCRRNGKVHLQVRLARYASPRDAASRNPSTAGLRSSR